MFKKRKIKNFKNGLQRIMGNNLTQFLLKY